MNDEQDRAEKAVKLGENESAMGARLKNIYRPRRPWCWQSNRAKKARQNAALRYLEILEKPIANADPVEDALWIGKHAGRIKRTRAWQAIQNDETGEALYTDWDDYCYFRWGRTGTWFSDLIRRHEKQG